MQVFFWVGPGTQRDGRTYYSAFALNGTTYRTGDSVYLFPEDENSPHYLGRIVSAFVDENAGHADPHCIEVKWYERRVNLEVNTRGIEESEKEVFELEDTDVNPIGCISGKNSIVRARTYGEAYQKMRGTSDWFFCRGYFLQATNSFQPYTPAELAIQDGGFNPALPELEGSHPQEMPGYGHGPGMGAAGAPPGNGGGSAGGGGGGGGSGGRRRGGSASASEREDHREARAGGGRSAGGSGGGGGDSAAKARKFSGRMCLECGATQTPQWREGPQGPRTLCNACGLRCLRAQNRANKRAGGGGSRGGRYGASPRAPYHRKRHVEEYDDEDDEEEEEEEEEDPDIIPPKRENRPVRQAALAALARTAVFARTGAFPKGEEPPEVAEGMDPAAYAAKKPRTSSADDPTGAAGGSTGTYEGGPQAQLPIAALDLPGLVVGGPGAGPDAAGAAGVGGAAGPGGAGAGAAGAQGAAEGGAGAAGAGAGDGLIKPPMDAAAAVNLLALSTVPSQDGTQSAAAAKLLETTAATVGSPRLVANTQLGSPKAGAQLLNMSADRGLGASLVDLQGTGHPAGGPGAGLGSSAGGPGGSAFDPTALVPPILTKSGLSANGLGGLALSQPGSALGGTSVGPPSALQSPLANPLAAILASGVLPGSPLGGLAALVSAPSNTAAAAPAAPAAPPSLPAAPPASSVIPGKYAALVAQASQFLPELAAMEPLFAALDSLPHGVLPQEVDAQLSDMRSKVEVASKGAAAAEAAVSAVSQVYQARQEAAEKARDSAAKAGNKLKEYLTNLMQQHSLEGSVPAIAQGQPKAEASLEGSVMPAIAQLAPKAIATTAAGAGGSAGAGGAEQSSSVEAAAAAAAGEGGDVTALLASVLPAAAAAAPAAATDAAAVAGADGIKAEAA